METELFVIGAAFLLAGLFGRLGRVIGLPTIPFFIVAGIAFGPHTPGVVLLEHPDEIYMLALPVSCCCLAFYLVLLQPILQGQEGAVQIASSTGIAFAVLVGLFALARWGGRFVRPLISTGDRALTTILLVGFGVFIAGLAHVAGASDAVGALMAGMVVAATGLADAVERLVIPGSRRPPWAPSPCRSCSRSRSRSPSTSSRGWWLLGSMAMAPRRPPAPR